MRTYTAALLLSFFCSQQAIGQTLLVNSQTASQRLNQHQLKAIFLGNTTHWQNGLPISLCIDTSHKEYLEKFTKDVTGKNIRSYKRLWSKRVFSGNASSMPKYLNNSEKIIHYVANRQGAICFISNPPQTLPKQVVLIEN